MSLILSGTDGLSDIDGSAATPAIRGTDANTGIFFPAADTIAFSEGGVEAMRIDSSGNVGIGASSPASRLNIATGASTSCTFTLTSNNTGTGAGDRGRLDFYSASNSGTAYQLGYMDYDRSDGTGTASYIAFANRVAGTVAERMRIDSSGNVGIGTSSPVTLLSLSGALSFTAVAATPAVGSSFFAPAANTLAFGTASTERMRIDSSGNVGIGTTSISNKLEVNGSVNLANGSNYGWGNQQTAIQGSTATNVMQFYTAAVERMRIDGGGNLQLGSASAPEPGRLFVSSTSASAVPFVLQQTAAGSTTQNSVVFYRNSTSTGTIQVTGTTTAYNTSSDYRLKENVQPMTGALAKVTAMKPCTYTWKLDGSLGEGFIAHELAEIVPQAVGGVKDAVDADGKIISQGIDTSFLVATLTAAIQEQQALITALTARITALETQSADNPVQGEAP